MGTGEGEGKWLAATARGSSEEAYPSFFAPSLFVENPLLPKRSGMLFPMDKQGKYVTRRPVFNSLGLGMFKAKATSASSGFQNPSRVMAVTSLIWKCATEASRARYGSRRFWRWMVNQRGRMKEVIDAMNNHPPVMVDIPICDRNVLDKIVTLTIIGFPSNEDVVTVGHATNDDQRFNVWRTQSFSIKH
ncbi:hypothetical protein RJ640_002970 [Escallonia rubra]|uniref:Uncharacterized protein n=1 Tax=Escallonia rubra TaxID=112253 RepID=A0AA88S0L4_9ASTE|nr:hypothetical protein RJ640_002970 [Escallonia rubra]